MYLVIQDYFLVNLQIGISLHENLFKPHFEVKIGSAVIVYRVSSRLVKSLLCQSFFAVCYQCLQSLFIKFDRVFDVFMLLHVGLH